jgi:hypothetical protein
MLSLAMFFPDMVLQQVLVAVTLPKHTRLTKIQIPPEIASEPTQHQTIKIIKYIVLL